MFVFFKWIYDLIVKSLRSKEEETAYYEKDMLSVEIKNDDQKARRLKAALDYSVKLPYYQKGYELNDDGSPKYFCNVWARKFLLGIFDYGLYDMEKDEGFYWLNYDISPVFGDDMFKACFGTTIEDAYDKAIEASMLGKIKGLTPLYAQLRADEGRAIWAVCKTPGWQHELIICPAKGFYNDKLGPKITQAGARNCSDIYIADPWCFGENWKNLDIKFYEFKLKGEK